MTTIEKINEIMCYDAFDGESAEDVFTRCSNNLNALPSPEIIDIVYAGGLQRWAEGLDVTGEKELSVRLMRAMRRTIAEPVFNNKKTADAFPPLANFFYFCQRLDRNGKLLSEAVAVADVAWNGVICKRITKERADAIFGSPDKEKYKAAVKRISEVYGMSLKDIEKLRYFVCQVRHEDHNPSLNKSIYAWSDEKKTGKTTVAKSIVSIMNGDVLANSYKYESTLATELQFGDHDLPLTAIYECVLLDEAAPKDTTKSYNSFKSKLTNNGCKYNPKHRGVISLKCNRNYFFTSNDDPKEFVRDKKERRIMSIKFNDIQEKLSFDDIYALWLEFCTNCEPESNWSKWYDSFESVDGAASFDIIEVRDELLLQKDVVFPSQSKTYTTVKQIAGHIYKNEPTPAQKKAVAEAMNLYFEKCRLSSNKSYFSVMLCRERVEELRLNEDTVEETEEDDLPF